MRVTILFEVKSREKQHDSEVPIDSVRQPMDQLRSLPRGRFRITFAAVTGCAVVAASVIVLLSIHEQDSAEFLRAYCTDCHNTIDWEGGIAFDVAGADVGVLTSSSEEVPDEIWEKAVRKLNAGLMPPADARRPSAAAIDDFTSRLEAGLDQRAAEKHAAPAEALSRLTRAEYANAVRDLLAFPAGPIVTSLPADQIVGGFDNISDALSTSPTLIESYVSAAMRISRQAIGDREAPTSQVLYTVPADLSQDRHIDGLPLGTRGGLRFEHSFPLDGVYEFRIDINRQTTFTVEVACDLAVILTVDGEPAAMEEAVGYPRHTASFRIDVPAGPRAIGAALLDRQHCVGTDELYDVNLVGGKITSLQIDGPFDPTGVGETPSRRAIFSCYPKTLEEEMPCASQIMTGLATRAYRRPVASDGSEIETLLGFYEQGRREGDFETGIQRALARLLVSPEFIFQFEPEPPQAPAGQAFRISDLALASRLSFFLWSSIPDDELLTLASQGRLSEPAVLQAQTQRMLKDPRSSALVENFAAQWLSLQDLRNALPQDREFDSNLREALELETEMFVASIIEEDRDVRELLDADYTFVNERLAEHYEIPGVRGSFMRRVELPESSPRRGLLGKGALLTATSVADRTSPVIRGEWIITRLLGAPVPEPPAGVEADLSDEAAIAREDDTLRERLERHRSNPTCAACHRIMDPVGLALENFDLVGRWRETDNGKPIDASAALTDGTVVKGPAELRDALFARSDVFVTAFTEQLLTYALGRLASYRDMPAVREIVREASRDDYRFSSIVRGIVLSEPFLTRIKQADAATNGSQLSAVEDSALDRGDGI